MALNACAGTQGQYRATTNAFGVDELQFASTGDLYADDDKRSRRWLTKRTALVVLGVGAGIALAFVLHEAGEEAAEFLEEEEMSVR